MAKRALNYFVLPSRPIAAGAATPNPGIAGVSVWSTIESAEIVWNGSSWELAGVGIGNGLPAALGNTATTGNLSVAARSDHVHSHGTGHTNGNHHAVASETTPGFLSSANYTKLASIATDANVSALTFTVTPPDVGTSAIGSSTEVAHADHVHRHGAQPADSAMHALATGTIAGFMASADFNKLALVEENATAPHTLGGGPLPLAITGSTGSLSTVSRQDHTHTHANQSDGTMHAPADATKAGFLTAADFTKLASVATSATSVPIETSLVPQPLSAAVGTAGSSTSATAFDHVHAHGAQTTATHHAAASGSVAGFMTAAQFTKLAGISENAPAEAPPTLASTAPAAITDAGDPGASNTAARQDHIHIHGDGLSDPNNHAVATGSAPGFVPAALQAKLDALIYAVSGAGVANAGKIPVLDNTGRIASEYASDTARGTIDDATQNYVLMPNATTQPAVNTDTAGGRLYVRSNSTGRKPTLAPANNSMPKSFCPFLGSSTKVQLYTFSPPFTPYTIMANATSTTGNNSLQITTDVIKNRGCMTLSAGYTAGQYTYTIYQIANMKVSRAKGFYVIITYVEGGPGRAVWPTGSLLAENFVGLNPSVAFTSGGSTQTTPNRVGFGCTHHYTAGGPSAGVVRKVSSCDANGGIIDNNSYIGTTSFSGANTDICELHLFANPADTTKLYYMLKNNTTNAIEEGIISTYLPDVNTLIAPGGFYLCPSNAVLPSATCILSCYAEQPY